MLALTVFILDLSVFLPSYPLGMSVEMMALLLVSVIQGQVVSVYNTEKQEACEHLDQINQTPHSSSAPQTASLHETVL